MNLCVAHNSQAFWLRGYPLPLRTELSLRGAEFESVSVGGGGWNNTKLKGAIAMVSGNQVRTDIRDDLKFASGWNPCGFARQICRPRRCTLVVR